MSTTETALMQQSSIPLTAGQIKAQVKLIQEVMDAVMEENTHYGTIPGTNKPSLWKPGAEKISMTFHIGIDTQIDADLSTADVIRYRIRAIATSQQSGTFLGSALGECSSDEEKYKWRAAVCREEFDETSDDRRRKKWKKGGNDSTYSVQQVRTEPADIANTVLKMAVKRAMVAVILQVTAASDCFTQDLEDMPEEVRNSVVDGESKGAAKEQKKSNGECISDSQAGRAFAIGKSKGFSVEQYRAVIKRHGYDSDKDIPKNPKTIYDGIVAELEKGLPQ